MTIKFKQALAMAAWVTDYYIDTPDVGRLSPGLADCGCR